MGGTWIAPREGIAGWPCAPASHPPDRSRAPMLRNHLRVALRHLRRFLFAGLIGVLFLSAARFAVAQAPCAQDSVFQQLDFWVGTWTVQAAETQQVVGTNRIEKVLRGCAIVEHWTSARERKGLSLFYYDVAAQTWKQVWVTDRATAPGGLKEKRLTGILPDGGVRFQGEIALPDGRTYLDRTTLTPQPDGRVRQVIERSTDGGTTWQVGFDAHYIPTSP